MSSGNSSTPTKRQVLAKMVRSPRNWITWILAAVILAVLVNSMFIDPSFLWSVVCIFTSIAYGYVIWWEFHKTAQRMIGLCPWCGEQAHEHRH